MAKLTVESVYNDIMEAMTTKTPGHCDQWNVRYQQLLNNDRWLKEHIDKVLCSGGTAHNAIYRGIDLSTRYSLDEIKGMISSGGFDDIFIGDYYDKQITTSIGGTETVRHVMADFDTFWNNGDSALTKHHATIVPKDCFKTTAKMNDTNETTGGYANSKMHKEVLPVYAEALQNANENHIITHRSLLSNGVSTTGNSNAGAGFTGYASGWQWYDTKLSLMSEIQLYGSTVLSSSFYDTGERNKQFSLFIHNPAMKVAGIGHNGSRYWYWLSAVVSASAFAGCGSLGYSDYNNASAEGCVRPYFLIG